MEYIYRVTGPDINNIDAPWATAEMPSRPAWTDTFMHNGREHAVRSVRRIAVDGDK